MIAAVGAAASVNYFGNAFYVFPPRPHESASPVRWRVIAVGVVSYLFLLRIFYLGLPQLLKEEAYYWSYSQRPALGYLDHPPMVAWLIRGGTAVFGDTEFGIRFGSFLCWFVVATFGYLTAREWFDKSTAFRAVLLLAVLPVFFVFSFYMTPDAPLIACWAGAVYYFQRALLRRNQRAWWGVGVFMGLGMLSKYTIALLGPAALLFMLVDRPSRRWLARPEPFAAAFVALILFSPVLIWNAQNQWASFTFQTVRRLDGSPEFGLPLLIGALALLLTPLGFVGMLAALLPASWGGPPLLGSHTAPDEKNGDAQRRCRMFAAVFTLVPLSIFVAYSLRHDPKFNWTGPLWLAAVPLLAWDVIPRRESPTMGIGAWGKQLWPPTIVLTMLIYGLGFHYLTLGFPGVPYPRELELADWESLARQVEVVEDEVERQIGGEPVVVGMDKYAIASQLAFYRTRVIDEIDEHLCREGVNYTTGRHLFGENSLMYEFWFPSSEQAGSTLILVDDESVDLERASLSTYFDQISPTRFWTVGSEGRPVKKFYYRIGYGYRPLGGREDTSSLPLQYPSASTLVRTFFTQILSFSPTIRATHRETRPNTGS